MSDFFTPPKVAELLGVSPDKVLFWIHTEQLAAANLAETPERRPRWRISRSDLEQFIASRSNLKPIRSAGRVVR